MQSTLLCPRVNSNTRLAAWHNLMPSLSHVCVLSAAFTDTPFQTLISLAYYETLCYAEKLGTFSFGLVHVASWKVSSLQYLSFDSVFVSVSELHALATQCPCLKVLRVFIDRTSKDVVFASFLNLQLLSLNTDEMQIDFECKLDVHIYNTPELKEFEILAADIRVLEFGANVGNLQRISAIRLRHCVDELIFQSEMPSLNHIDLGYSDQSVQFDPFNKVDWKHVKMLQFGYNICCDVACSQLRDVEHLAVTNTIESANPCIPWVNMNNLHHLDLDGMTSAMFHAFSLNDNLHSSLTSLRMDWEMDDGLIVDLDVIAKFVNLEHLLLFGKHIHFEALLTLKYLQKKKFTCVPLTLAERALFEKQPRLLKFD